MGGGVDIYFYAGVSEMKIKLAMKQEVKISDLSSKGELHT